MAVTQTLQRGLVHRSRWVRIATVFALAIAISVPVGASIGLLGWLYGSAFLVGMAATYLMLRSVHASLVIVILVICLIPFAALPFDIGFSPTFLDLALVGLFFVWIARLVSRKDREFLTDSPTVGVLLFAGLAVAAFILGLTHAPMTPNVVRHFGEVLLSILLFLLVINTVRRFEHLRLMILALIVAGFVAAMVGVVLYALPDNVSVRLLSALRVVRYPSGSDVLRYIEDNPELPLRAISTSVDPNILGGMLIFVTTITAAQAFSPSPILDRRLLYVMFATMALCLVLTFSRSSFAGLAAALILMGLLRYRRLLWLGIAALALLLLLPSAEAYVAHFSAGVQGRDLATQMRFGEYKDAFILIGRHPWMGVGFSGVPEIDTYLGVSSVYLLIAEEMGLIGLSVFLATLVALLFRFFSAVQSSQISPRLEPYVLGTSLAIVGAMAAGALDHYLFNLDFPHASALLWLTLGLAAVSIRLGRAESAVSIAGRS